MTSVVDAPERNGLVTRSPHPTDHRKVLITITAPGVAIVERKVAYRALTDASWRRRTTYLAQ